MSHRSEGGGRDISHEGVGPMETEDQICIRYEAAFARNRWDVGDVGHKASLSSDVIESYAFG